MKTVYKYPVIRLGEPCTVSIPYGALLVHVGLDPSEALCVWMEVDTEELRHVSWSFRVVMTGGTVPPDTHHLGTVRDGEYMLHVYVSHKIL